MQLIHRALTTAVALAVLQAVGCSATSPEAPSPVESETTAFDVARAQASPVPVPGGVPSPTTSPTPAPSPSPTPKWASTGGWIASGASETSTRPSVPAQTATFTALEKQFAAGQTVSLGPNLLRNCAHGFQPRMYYVRVTPVKAEPLP